MCSFLTMKLITLHSDYIKFTPKKAAIKEAEKVKEKPTTVRNCLVVLIAVEKSDESNALASKQLVQEIVDVASQVKVKNIVLYPYAHLSSELGEASKALKILKNTEKILSRKFKVTRAPFGWYKAFEISVKGHPLAELSRTILPEKTIGRKVKERKKGSEFIRFILISKDGKEHEINKQNWENAKIWKLDGDDYKRLKIFVRNEFEGNPVAEEPKHISYMQKLELVNYCPESDIGHFKWHPKGLLIKDLILMFQENLAIKYGAFKISNPLLYRLSVPDISALLGEFREKDYSWREDNETFILRFASDPGAFPYMQKLAFSYKDLPIKEYEEAICFRKEQRGECTGLRRVRNFTMTDLHAFCLDEKQTKEEYEKLCIICKELMNSIVSKGRWVLGWEIVEEFYKKNKSWILGIIKRLDTPSLIKIMKERSHYYSLKNEYQSIEADEGNNQISTVQFDEINGKRFNINYVGKDGKKYPCLIIHCSTFGSIERALCSILENAAIDEQEGKLPTLPLWLSPTQVRLIPVSIESHLSFANKLADEFENEKVRVDIDDKVETVSKRIRNAEEEWVPYILVVGDKEVNSNTVVVRERGIKEQKAVLKNKFIEEIKEKTKNMPFKPLSLSRFISKRPCFN